MNTKFIVFLLAISLLTSLYPINYSYAAIPGIKMFLCANNPLGDMYDKEGITPGKIMNNCKEKLDGYSWGSRIYTLIYAPGFNKDPNALETIGKTFENNLITAHSREGEMSLQGATCNGFIETGRDHGLFYGSIKLSGFRYDVNGDGSVDVYGGNRCESPSSGSTGTIDDGSGRVEAKQDGAVTITFRYNEDDSISKTAKYSWREATLAFDQPEYLLEDTVKLTLTDLDNVRYPFDDKLGFPVRVYSDSDKAGIDLSAYWVANYKGIVQMNGHYPMEIKLKNYDTSEKQDAPFGNSKGELRVSIGDNIYAEYYDYTLPKPYSIGENKKITTTAKIVKSKVIPELNAQLVEEESDIKKLEYKKYTFDGKYLITGWWEKPEITTGSNTLNISIVDGKTQKDVYNIPYTVNVYSDKNHILEQKNTYNGKSTIDMFLDNQEITEITFSEIGTSSDIIKFKFDVKSQNSIENQITPINMQNTIPDNIRNNFVSWINNSEDESMFRNNLQLLIDNKLLQSDTNHKQSVFPKWVKTQTTFWLDKSLSDIEFLHGLEYLMKKGIL